MEDREGKYAQSRDQPVIMFSGAWDSKTEQQVCLSNALDVPRNDEWGVGRNCPCCSPIYGLCIDQETWQYVRVLASVMRPLSGIRSGSLRAAALPQPPA